MRDIKLRVAVFVHSFPPALGGLEYFAGELKSALAEIAQPIIVTGKGLTLDSYKTFTQWVDSDVDYENNIYRLELNFTRQRWMNRLLGKSIRFLPQLSHWYFGPILKYTPEVCSMLKSIDVVFALGMPTMSFVESARWARIANAPLIAIPAYHDVSYYNNNPSFDKVLSQAKRVLCFSPLESRTLKLHYPNVANKIELIKFSPFSKYELEHIPCRLPLEAREKRQLTIGFVGQICRRKRLDLFPLYLTSIARNLGKGWQIKVLLAGAWTNESASVERELYSQINKGRLKIIYDFVDKTTIYKQIDIFINPSNEESFGIVNLEAMRYGLPVFSSRHSPLSEIVPMTSFDNPDELGLRIAKLIRVEKMYRFHLSCQKKFLQKRTREDFVTQIRDILSSSKSIYN